MPSLSDRLKALGVQIGGRDLPDSKRKTRHPIETVVDGRIVETAHGETYVAESRQPLGAPHGQGKLEINAPLEMVANWGRDTRIATSEIEQFAFLDTETTGLGGGPGTYVFLVGAGRFEGEEFHLAQFFLRELDEEPALLAGLESFLAPCEVIVTFNGKAFDVPLLNARYLLNSAPSPLPSLAHLDLLHLTRRLWRERLPSCSLGSLEEHILGLERTGEDVPGWMIPELYLDYLREGDARPLKGVFYHNAVDILSLAALMNHIADMLAQPLTPGVEDPLDRVAMGRLYESLGYFEQATEIIELSLQDGLPTERHLTTVKRLSLLHRRMGNYEAALELWQEAADHRQVYAHVEIAKHYEHRQRDFEEAIRWTEAALEIIAAPEYSRFERSRWQPELEHRLARLKRKLDRLTD